MVMQLIWYDYNINNPGKDSDQPPYVQRNERQNDTCSTTKLSMSHHVSSLGGVGGPLRFSGRIEYEHRAQRQLG
jgi:hypothetical protein